ncbi:MAG: hypothetical protein V8T87_15755 [Victivallales bacterium]
MSPPWSGHGSAFNDACVPVNSVVPIPDSVTMNRRPSLSAATSLQAVRRTEPALGEDGAVLGLGIVGNIAAQLYRLSGARVIGWERNRLRIATAKKCGIADAVDFIRKDAVEATKLFASPGGWICASRIWEAMRTRRLKASRNA